jgi:hypothetical protein
MPSPPPNKFSITLAILLILSHKLSGQAPPTTTSTISPHDLHNFHHNPPIIQRLIHQCLELTSLNLRYTYGSADPRRGGLDCSGFVHYNLLQLGYKNPPRDSTQIYLWLEANRTLRKVNDENPHDRQLRHLKPGDILFWEGTYNVKRTPPISHVMIYLGTHKITGRPLMAGASQGRTYRGQSRNGVSVFDFVLPNPKHKRISWWFWSTTRTNKTRFVAYGTIPGIHQLNPRITSQTPTLTPLHYSPSP